MSAPETLSQTKQNYAGINHPNDCDYHADQFPHECTCGLMALLRQQHEAMADVMQLRRLSENQRQRDTANAAIAVWWRVNAFLKGRPMPSKHRFWGAGDADCPTEIKAGNGELHTLRCKACGLDDPKDNQCLGS